MIVCMNYLQMERDGFYISNLIFPQFLFLTSLSGFIHDFLGNNPRDDAKRWKTNETGLMMLWLFGSIGRHRINSIDSDAILSNDIAQDKKSESHECDR